MRVPARIEPWMTDEEWAVWVRAAPNAEALRKRPARWMPHAGPCAARGPSPAPTPRRPNPPPAGHPLGVDERAIGKDCQS